MRVKFFIILLLVLMTSAGCAGNFDIFPALGDKMSNPITVAVDSGRARLYINNSNYKVGYKNGSIHVVDITNPAAPVRVNYVEVPSFDGEMYVDPVTQLLYTPNRYSSTELDRADNLYQMNVNEASADFLTYMEYPSSDDPYGLVCCDAASRLLTASDQGFVDYYELNNSLAHGSLDLTSTLSTGAILNGTGATRIRIFGSQALVTREEGGVWIVNLNELGVAGTNPVDYYIGDVFYPQGIATDGTYIYIVSVDYTPDPDSNVLLVLNIASLPPDPSNTVTQYVDKDDAGLVVASIDLGVKDPRELFIVGTTAYVAHFSDDLLSIVDITTYTKTGEITTGDEPYGMGVYSPGGTPTHLILTNSGPNSNSVSLIDLATNTIVGTYP